MYWYIVLYVLSCTECDWWQTYDWIVIRVNLDYKSKWDSYACFQKAYKETIFWWHEKEMAEHF